jgi:2-hydroxychromene-2-carboxylate isomerase
MGDLIVLADFRQRLVVPALGPRPHFYFDLGCPFSYLAAERVERMLGNALWLPSAPVIRRPGLVSLSDGADQLTARERGLRHRAQQLAQSLRLPLVWPENPAGELLGVARAARFAAEQGAGPRFALAASRLAFCGGFDLEDPEILADAAAAAGLDADQVIDATTNPELDLRLQDTADELRGAGVHGLPALRVGDRWLDGELGLDQAAALVRVGYHGPLAPVC